MPKQLKLLVIGPEDHLPDSAHEILRRDAIRMHRVQTAAEALILTGNMPYDLLMVAEPLPDLDTATILGSLQSLDWTSAGAPAMVFVSPAAIETAATGLQRFPVRVLSRDTERGEIQQAMAELLGVAVRSSMRMIVNIQVELEEAGTLRCFQSENLSESGMLLRGARSIPVGAPLRVAFNLPDETDPITGKAIVVRHTGPGEAEGIGIRFVDFAESHVLRLRRFVDQSLGNVATDARPGERPHSTPAL